MNLVICRTIVLLAAALCFPLISRAGVVYSDSFESDGNQGPPANFVFTTDNYQTPTNGSSGSSAMVIDDTQYSFGYTAPDGKNFLLFHADGVPNGTSTDVQLDLTNADVGATFQADTTYTLTYFSAATQIPLTLSLLSNGLSVASGVNATTGTNTFTEGTPVTIDTLTDSSLVGSTIGVQAGAAGNINYDRYSAFDDIVITATADAPPAVPEPASVALLFAGLLLLGLKFRSTAKRQPFAAL